GGSSLQALAARARVDSNRAQLETANALLQQARQRRAVGLVAQVDADRAEVQALIQQQRLIALQNDFAKLKIDLARLIGAQPTDQFSLTEDLPFVPAPALDASAAQVAVNERNLQVSRETLELTRQRFEAGVSGNIEVVQAQDSVSGAVFEYINSVFSHNVAKLNLARALGNTEVRIREYLRR